MRGRIGLALAACCLASPALAQQSGTALPPPDEAGKGFTLALGVGTTPDYVGSNDYRIIPAGAIRGAIGPVSVTTRSTYLYADFFPRRADRVDFDLGPIVGINLNRTIRVHDAVVRRLPKRDTAVEAGGFAGISLHNLTNPYDTLAFRLDVVHDIAGAHESTVFGPNIEFSTPLSRFTYVGVSAGADFVSNRFADYYFGITPADSLASGLPVFNPDGGFEKWHAGLLLNQSVTGDLTGGLSIFGTANYSHLQGDFRRSPIVSLRGRASQWLLAGGLAYTWH